jgi:hypothetical protein
MIKNSPLLMACHDNADAYGNVCDLTGRRWPAARFAFPHRRRASSRFWLPKKKGDAVSQVSRSAAPLMLHASLPSVLEKAFM